MCFDVNMISCRIVFVALIYQLCRGVNGDLMSKTDMMNYLDKYGYTNGKDMGSMSEKEIEDTLKAFQEFNNLPVTGKMDDDTNALMNTARCGRPDRVPLKQEFAANREAKWRKRHITYQFKNFPRNNYDRRTTVRETRRAFNVWSDVANLTFQQVAEGRADIDIYFYRASDGDGKSGTLAYAYFPERGDMHFDAEDWTVMGRAGINYFQVATHEIGHSIGLEHQKHIPQAVMAPYYHGYLPNYKLHANDVERIQRKYGRNSRGPAQSFCSAMGIDAAFSTAENTLYVLNNDRVWKYANERLASGYPRAIENEWPGLPGNIDAAYQYKNLLYFYKNEKAFVYDGVMRDYSFGENISRKIDAAVLMSDRLYMFIGDNYWKFSTEPKIVLQKNYPARISSFWTGIPSFINTVYYDNKRTLYFFKGRQMYKFDIFTKRAISGTIANWFPCRN